MKEENIAKTIGRDRGEEERMILIDASQAIVYASSDPRKGKEKREMISILMYIE